MGFEILTASGRNLKISNLSRNKRAVRGTVAPIEVADREIKPKVETKPKAETKPKTTAKAPVKTETKVETKPAEKTAETK